MCRQGKAHADGKIIRYAKNAFGEPLPIASPLEGSVGFSFAFCVETRAPAKLKVQRTASSATDKAGIGEGKIKE